MAVLDVAVVATAEMVVATAEIVDAMTLATTNVAVTSDVVPTMAVTKTNVAATEILLRCASKQSALGPWTARPVRIGLTVLTTTEMSPVVEPIVSGFWT